ncbi:MAG: hypothetical protein K2X82_14935, partial [Gemmataceae bacterium]|nr:hypothetical protein [Gemmataceae bacterium]
QPHLNGPPPTPEPVPAAAPTVTAAPLPDDAPPAALVPTPGRWERFGWYAGAVVATALLIVAGLRLDRADLRAPLAYDDDALLIMPLVKATLERGHPFGHWRNPRLGHPWGQELHDFPVVDHLHLLLVWLTGQVVPDWVVAFNLYHLLTWPLTALTAMWAFRRLGLTLPFAAAGGVLYAFLPYHYLRGEVHYFLAAYWVVPLSWLPALAMLKGELPFFRRDGAGGYAWGLRRWATLGQVVLALATASAGAYYAFFACAIYSFVGLYAAVARRTWKPLASAGLLIVLVGGFGVLNHLPAFLYTAEHGRNGVTERTPEEAEIYGLKLAHLVLPIDAHNLTVLGQLKARYGSGARPLDNENTYAPLGVIGAAGLLGLLAVLVLPVGRRWPYGPLAAVTGFVLLLAVIGGFGSVFNLLVMDQVRGYNRFSVYLAFTCLFAALWWADKALLTRPRWHRLRVPAAVGLVALGIADQTPTAWFADGVTKELDKAADRFRADRAFFAAVEEQLGPDAAVFSVPYVPYPEVLPVHKLNTYEHARGFLHTDTLRWAYGGMKGRYADAWYQHVAHRPLDELARRVACRGFDAILVDKRGFTLDPFEKKNPRNYGDVVIDALRRAAAGGKVKLPVVVREETERERKDGRGQDRGQVVVDIRPYREWLRAQDPAQFAAWEREEREWPAVLWLAGFYAWEPYGLQDKLRWGGRAGTAVVVNPSDRTRKYLLRFTVGVDDTVGPFTVRIDGGGLVQLNKDGGPGPWEDEIEVRKEPGDWGKSPPRYGEGRGYILEVPPGEHRVTFRCTPPPKFMPSDPRPVMYFLKDISLTEVK